MYRLPKVANGFTRRLHPEPLTREDLLSLGDNGMSIPISGH
jgi:hypothetical protein